MVRPRSSRVNGSAGAASILALWRTEISAKPLWLTLIHATFPFARYARKGTLMAGASHTSTDSVTRPDPGT